MKDNTISLRTTAEEKETLKQAAENLAVLTNEKPSISKAIRAGVKILADQDPGTPELFFVNRRALQDLQRHLEYGCDVLQKIHDEYYSLMGASIRIEEMEPWFGQYSRNFLVPDTEVIRESIVHTLYIRQKNKYPDLQFNMDNIILPDLDQLYEVCGQLIFIPTIEGREMMLWRCYQVTSGKVELIPAEVRRVQDGWRAYAEGPEEKQRLSTVKKLVDILNTIKISSPEQIVVPGIAKYDPEAGIYVPLHNYVKGILK